MSEPMPVLLTDDAACDLEDIYDYITSRDVPGRAEHVLSMLERAFNSLQENPQRGVCPQELRELGITEFREIFFKPYRVIYRIIDKSVYVFVVADGRRDMQSLLQRRLLRPSLS